MADPFAYMLAKINLWQEPLTLGQGQSLSLCYGAAVWEATPEQIETLYLKWIDMTGSKRP
jgi:hypothetical protein